MEYSVTSAEAHDSQELKNLAVENDKRIYGDSAYTGKEVQGCIPGNVENRIHEKKYRNNQLKKTQIKNNMAKSKIRARAGHVFAAMSHYGGKTIGSTGMARAEIQIGLLNLAYNIKRYACLMGAGA
jgi:IS5 family transposase